MLGQKGYTLLELLVSLFIISMVTAAVVVTLPSDKRHLDAGVNRVMAMLKAARNNAILSGAEHEIRFDVGQVELLKNVDGGWQSQKRYQHERGIDQQLLSAAGQSSAPGLRFQADGLSSDFRLQLKTQQQQRCITGSGNGQFQIQDSC